MKNNGSRKARRMLRHNNLRKAAPLNLVSLMDIFTILVFFLLVNSSSAPQLPNKKDLSLPVSTTVKAPKETLILIITQQNVLVQGRAILSVKDIINTVGDVLLPLKKELELQVAGVEPSVDSNGQKQGYSITIMGDESTPYLVMNKILATCQQAQYTNIAFAANQKAKLKPSSSPKS